MCDHVRESQGTRLILLETVLAMVAAVAIALTVIAAADYIRRVAPHHGPREHRHLVRIPFAQEVFGGRWW